MKLMLGLLLALVLLALGALALATTGRLSFAADEPHAPWLFDAIQALRERSIAARSRGVNVPDLDDPQRVALGAGHYAEMCTGCHLAPGMDDTELRAGLYPQPPRLSTPDRDALTASGDRREAAARQFWIIKHGIKGSGMPAWGLTHDDASVWGLVAFVQKLPGLSPAEYQRLTRASEPQAASAMEQPVHVHAHGHHHHGELTH